MPPETRSLKSALNIAGCLALLHWLVRGTGNGDKALSFKGVSIIKIEDDKIRSDEAYFDPG